MLVSSIPHLNLVDLNLAIIVMILIIDVRHLYVYVIDMHMLLAFFVLKLIRVCFENGPQKNCCLR